MGMSSSSSVDDSLSCWTAALRSLHVLHQKDHLSSLSQGKSCLLPKALDRRMKLPTVGMICGYKNKMGYRKMTDKKKVPHASMIKETNEEVRSLL